MTSRRHTPRRARRTARGAARERQPKPGDAPESDYHFVDRLGYLFNGAGFVDHQIAQLWLVEVATGEARRLTEEPRRRSARRPGRPDGAPDRYTRRTSAATTTSSPGRTCVVLDVDGGGRTRLTGDAAAIVRAGMAARTARRWRRSAAICRTTSTGSDVWLIAADGSDARSKQGGRNLTGATT